jgi:carboxypeptidase Taq
VTATVVAAALIERLRRIAALERVYQLIGWDQETQMPPRGVTQRAEEAAAVAAALHGLCADPALGDLADAVEAEGATGTLAIEVAEARRLHLRATRVPARLAADLAHATAEAHAHWVSARATRDFPGFAPRLARVVELTREAAASLADPGITPYDALLDEHEPGMTGAELAALFDALRPGLVDLRARIAAAARPMPRPAGAFPADAQLALSRRVAGALGYDWASGRLDLAAHPSCSGRLGDVRITTRIAPDDPFECLYATIHETGHALYEQGLDPEGALSFAGAHASMGVHESQSRLYENQIGRSRAFAEWLFPLLAETFGAIAFDDPDSLNRAVNRVETGFIRTEADEVHYNLHVMMRFDLERALIGGSLAVAELEEAWNARFAADFSRTPPHAAQGVLQDVHWAAGLFGYFPTYTLGNVYAAELDAALRAERPRLDDEIANGDFAPTLAFLRTRIHRRGRALPAAQLVAEATGRAPDPATLLGALEAKYGALYALAS